MVRAGLQRIARDQSHGEGSSRYWMNWRQGVMELHSFCVGWYPHNPGGKGIIFIRSQERLFTCTGGEPVFPGVYENARFARDGADGLLEAVSPLFSWVCQYESRVRKLAGVGYRQKCWMRYLSKPGARPWLPPDDAVRWLRDFVRTPASVPRPREVLRRAQPLTPSKTRKTADRNLPLFPRP